MKAHFKKQLEKASSLIGQVHAMISEISDSQEDEFHALTEAEQETPKGVQLSESVDALQNAITSLDDVESYINTAVED